MLIEVKNLTKLYATGETEVRALDDVSLSVGRGEFVSIVGSSGSGKSTLLHLIGGLDIPTSGQVIIDGCDIYSLAQDPPYSIPQTVYRLCISEIQPDSESERVGEHHFTSRT